MSGWDTLSTSDFHAICHLLTRLRSLKVSVYFFLIFISPTISPELFIQEPKMDWFNLASLLNRWLYSVDRCPYSLDNEQQPGQKVQIKSNVLT